VVSGVAAAVVLQLLVGVLSLVLLDRQQAPATAPVVAVEQMWPAAVPAVDDRRVEVDALLATRSAALLGRDRAAFLATVDPASTELLTRQGALFDALAEVPLEQWAYRILPDTPRAGDTRLDRRYGTGQWWAPGVTLGYSLAKVDTRATVVQHHLTFVLRDSRWLLGADDDFAAIGRATPRALWDLGPVTAVRAEGTLVLGRPDAVELLRDVAQLTAAAIPKVTDLWGEQWQREVVVVVPTDAAEMAALLGGDIDLTSIAAVATAELTGGGTYDPAADRILVNPTAFQGLASLGRRVVLTHEVLHVASRRATGPALPAWLAEGLADYVADLDADVPLRVSVRELRRDVRAGRLPERLPVDTDFNGANPKLAQAYEQSWLAVRLLVEQHGEAALLRFYRQIGAARDIDSATALETAFAAEFATTTEQFISDWRAALQRQLG